MAPLALLVALAAVGYVVSSATREGDQGGSSSKSQDSGAGGTSTGTTASTTPKTTTASSQKSTYTVKPGDTLGMIAEETGVSVAELQELNPELDPQSLTVGDRIRLRR
jgi:LysM repeat protein